MTGAAAPRIAVVGASLGGLDAFRTLLAGLPEPFAAALILVQHRRPDPHSRLAEILDPLTPMPVSEPDSHETIEAGHVYIAPADYHLLIERGRFVLSCEAVVMWARPSIDVLFESAATAFGSRTAAALLTGASADGAAGLEAVHAAGGLTLVQDPATAQSPIAPRAALARFTPTRVLALAELPAALGDWASNQSSRPREAP